MIGEYDEILKGLYDLEAKINVVTLNDNLSHDYFSSIEWGKDNYSPIGIAKLECLYDPKIMSYWSTYKGTVIVNADLRNSTTKNKPYNYSFIGKVNRFKQKGYNLIITLEDIGYKFLEKVPQDFRDNFIANQTLGDAFQAICEFLDVEFAYSIDDLEDFTFANDGFSIKKNGETIEEVNNIFKILGSNKQEEESSLNSQTFENSGLINYNQKQTQQTTQQSLQNSSLASSSINSRNQIQNEVDNDKKKEKKDKYQKNFDKKIRDLFKGNVYYQSNIESNTHSYDNITIEPKDNNINETNMSSTTPLISSVGSSNSVSNNNENNKSNKNNKTNENNISTTHSINKKQIEWIIDQYYSCRYVPYQKNNIIKRIVNAQPTWNNIAKITNTLGVPCKNAQEDAIIRALLKAK